MSLSKQIKKAAELLSSANHGVALTGAGISTESGIPDFRSPGTGLWEREDPEDFTIESFERDPHSFYRRIHPLLQLINQARPNHGHHALVTLEMRGIIKTIITQNVDGLHQKAGSRNVLEVHGSFQKGTCYDCGKKNELEDLNALLTNKKDPNCSYCGGIVKPDVTLFGEQMPDEFQLAHREALKCDCMLVVGSSLQVAPVGFLPRYTQNLLIINKGTTPYDEHARVVIREPSGLVLPKIVEEIEQM